MWNDNRATVDLVGFQRYADAIANLVLSKRLLPLTVGVYGEWGSGKSTVMYLAEQRLLQEDNTICITFNSWMLQGYDDTKAALMTKIIEALKKELDPASKALEKAKHLLKMVDWFRLTALTLKHVLVPVATSYATATAPVFVPPSTDDIARLKADDDDSSATQTIEEFREEFEALIEEAKIRTLVVFVDDLDRCLPSTVVDILETIKLFLSVDRTAFVIGADESTIKQAVASHYPQTEDIETVSKIYLEKIVQVPVHIHPLSESETETYVNLLFAELHVEPADLQKLAEVAAQNRNKAPLRTALDYELIRSTLGDKFEPEYDNDLNLAARIAPVICQHERGNPRQIKRFLNTLLLRQQVAAAYGLTLDAQILSKLMILEYYHTEPHFKQLFEWQMAGGGTSSELAALEQLAQPKAEDLSEEAGVEEMPATLPKEITQSWLENSDLKHWLQMPPLLGSQSLEQYFFVARERLAKYGFEGAELSRNVREILSLLLGDNDVDREKGKTRALQLTATEVEGLYSAAAGKIAQVSHRSDLVKVLCELAGEKCVLIPVLVSGLKRVPDAGMPISVPNRLGILVETCPDHRTLLVTFLEELSRSSNTPLAVAAKKVLSGIEKGGN